MFQSISIPWGELIYIGAGALVGWAKLGRERRKVYVLAELIAAFKLDERLKISLEILIFIVFGCVVTIGIVEPKNAAQAFAAGLSWTALCSSK